MAGRAASPCTSRRGTVVCTLPVLLLAPTCCWLLVVVTAAACTTPLRGVAKRARLLCPAVDPLSSSALLPNCSGGTGDGRRRARGLVEVVRTDVMGAKMVGVVHFLALMTLVSGASSLQVDGDAPRRGV